MKNEYTVAEFRSNIRKALNQADAGEIVVISRYGTDYLLVTDNPTDTTLDEDGDVFEDKRLYENS